MSKKKVIINNSSIVKQTNVELVRKCMRQVRTATRNEISVMTGLSIATSGNILKEMLRQNEVSEYRLEEPNGGRPAHRYRYNGDFIQAACIGIFYDSQVRSIWYTVVNSFGEVLKEDSAVYENISYDTISSIAGRISDEYPAVKSIVVSIPGKSWKDTIYICDIKELEGISLEEKLREDHKTDITVESEIDLITLGYYKAHPEFEGKTLVTILYPKDTYPGAGTLIDGKLMRGDQHMAGEISFISSGATRESNLADMFKTGDLETSLMISTTAMISIINPSLLIFTGRAMSSDLMDKVREKCRAVIPDISLPEFEYVKDNFQYYRNGMITLALHNTTSGLQLVSSI